MHFFKVHFKMSFMFRNVILIPIHYTLRLLVVLFIIVFNRNRIILESLKLLCEKALKTNQCLVSFLLSAILCLPQLNKNTLKYAFLIIVCSFTTLQISSAQEEYYNFDIWEASTTKASSVVLDIYQDDDGLIWLSTFNGVIRFDGSHFDHIADIYPEYDAIPTSHISCVRKDIENNLWIGTIGDGLFKMTEDGHFSSFSEDIIGDDVMDEYRIEDIIFTDSLLYIQGRNGLNTFRINQNKYVKVKDITSESDKNIRSVLKYKDDLIFTTKNAILSLKGSIGSEVDIRNPQLFIDKEGVLWKSIKKEEGTIIFKFLDGVWEKNETQPLLKVSSKRKLIWDYQKRLWALNYNNNVICYSFNKKKWIVEKDSDNYNLDQRRVRAVMVDNSGTVWIGSDVISLYRKRQDIRSIRLPIAKKDEVMNFIFDEGRLFYSINIDGFFILDDSGITHKWTSSNSDLSHNRYVKFSRLDSNKLGIAHSGGFQVLDTDDKFSPVVPFSGSNRSICYHAGYYWVGGVSKIVKIDPYSLEMKKYPLTKGNKAQNIYINGLVAKSDNELYVGSSLKKLQVFNIENEEFDIAESLTDKVRPPSSCNALSISKNSILGIASENGLFTYNGSDFKRHIPRKYFRSLAWANDSLLLASTMDEIYKINIYTNDISVLSQDNGLLNSQFALRSVGKYGSELCFGGNKGLDCILADTPQDTLPTILRFESLTVNNNEKIILGNENEQIVLPQNTRHVALKLDQIYTKSQSSSKILYRNNDELLWQELSNNMLILDNPRPGNHKFEFKTSIEHYAGKIKNLQVEFEIPVPWYRHFLFWFIASVAVISSIAWLVINNQNRRRESQLKDVQLKADIAELRLNALSGQMNPHFTFNALNSILQMINEQDTESASKYVQKFSSMMRFVIEYSDQSWVSLEKELKFLEDYLQLEKMRFNESFSYNIDINSTSELSLFMIPPFFLQPKIENALKHGIRELDHGGKIDIRIRFNEQTIAASIIDNGIGRKESMLKNQFQSSNTQKGIELTKNRLIQLNKLGYEASINIVDLYKEDVPAGTQIDLILPLKKLNAEV